MDPEAIYESDFDPRYEDGYVLAESDLLTYDEWWAEYEANACCASPQMAARWLCGCRGSGAVPSGISRLLERPEPDGDDFYQYDDDDGYGPYGRDCE